MNSLTWKSLPINNLITRNVIYFDERKKDIIRKICELLMIDCFPDINEEKYWKLTDGKWDAVKIHEELILNPSLDCFDESILNLFEKSDSNLIFSTNSKNIDGIIHFTNYENNEIYSLLYQNLNEFERNLRVLLSSLGYNYESFLKYYQYKLKKERNAKSIKYFKGKIKELSSDNLKPNEIQPLERLYLRELLDFSISSFHSPDDLVRIGLKFSETKIRSQSIGELRNTIMHSKGFTGKNELREYDFGSFRKFFSWVIEFKKLFDMLSQRMSKLNTEQILKKNTLLLNMLGEMDEQSVKNYFYSNY